MEFLVIILCLLSERFLIHSSSHHRFRWFMMYSDKVSARVLRLPSWVVLAIIVLPLVLIAWIFLFFFEAILFGFVGFVLNLFIFYYCLGPVNPFYPVRENPDQALTNEEIGDYLAAANEQLFAVIFWYIVLGPLSIISYRILSLCQGQPAGSPLARQLLDLFDFIPARLTALLYLFAGDFQRGLQSFCKLFFSPPSKNQLILHHCGLASLGLSDHNESKTMRHVEQLVEHATIILLVFLAVFTMASYR
jgi:AmpE protein